MTGPVTLHLGDCLTVMAELEPNSVDAVVTDPPYELSNDGKQSAKRVFFEFAFPQDAKIVADGTSKDHLAVLVNKVLGLYRPESIPGPAPAMPVVPVAFDDEPPFGQDQIENTGKSPSPVPNAATIANIEPELPEHLGSFFLELADPAHLFHLLNDAGTGFHTGGIGIGLAPLSSCLPCLLARRRPIIDGGDEIRLFNDSLTNLVAALGRTRGDAMLRFDLGRGAIETLSADGACLLAALLLASGSKLVRAKPAASRLPSMLESRRICVIDGAATVAFTFNLVVHPQNLSSNGFMGKSWDGSKIAYDVAVWRECFRVLKPGGHLLAFGGSRTYHRMACAVEDAGFEIRDQIMWVFGSGFPKSHNLGGEWDGWGTALKPAHEPIVVARKPLVGAVAENVRLHGTGALNIDRCRVGHVTVNGGNLADNPHLRTHINGGNGGKVFAPENERRVVTPHSGGRWPANLIHDGSEEVVAAFPTAEGQQAAVTGQEPSSKTNNVYRQFNGRSATEPRGDNGSAARFFYCAKASRRDREEGLDGAPLREGGMRSETSGQHITRRDGGTPGLVRNHHPTVKPTDLMRYLCRLVTPPGGIILDPFAGSGSTLKAAILEGFRCVGIEREPEYFEIAQRRIEHAGRQPDLFAASGTGPEAEEAPGFTAA